MRCVAGVGLLVLVGCNQVFGISASQPWDAPIPPHYAVLTSQLALTSSGGAPAPDLAYPALTGMQAPQIRIAPLDAPFVAATYDTAAGVEGRIDLPPSYIAKDATGHNAPWRLEYTMTGPGAGPPHEVQWAPDDTVGHLVVPGVGRVDRDTAPSMSGYHITPSNPPSSYGNPQVWTTGAWSAGLADKMGMSLDYALSNATSLGGIVARPDPAFDLAFAVDFLVDGTTSCNVAVGSAQITDVTVDIGMLTPEAVTWDSTRKPVVADAVMFSFISRLTAGLGGTGGLHGAFSAAGSLQAFGVMPARGFPGLTGTTAGFQLPTPVMQMLLTCPYSVTPLPSTSQPMVLVSEFPNVLHVQLIDSRSVASLGLTLFSGIETVLAPQPAGGFAMSFPAAIPMNITLTTPATAAAAGPLDLVAGPDQAPAGAPSGPFVLDFVPETGPGLSADAYDVLLHRIGAAGALTTERVYTVTAPRVRIDPDVLVGGADYVFEIRSYKGYPMAAAGDFSVVQYPYGGAVVFTRTFKTS